MLKRELIDTAEIADGETLELYSHGRDFMIVLGRNELMSTRMRFSEEQLAELTLARLGKDHPRILIGGYGMGFTYRAARAKTGERAQIVVAEIADKIIAWAEGPMAALTGDCLADPRLDLKICDVAALIDDARAASPKIDFLNGIAWDKVGRELYLTGKLWPWLYQVSLEVKL